MKIEMIEKENYRKTSGVQELQWSKGKNPVLTPPNFIETNLITITDYQFITEIAARYGVNVSDLFPEYLTKDTTEGNKEKQSRVMLRQIENILTQEKRYRFVIQGDADEEYIYPLDGFEIAEESVVQSKNGEIKQIEVTSQIYQECAKIVDRYTQKSYLILEGGRGDIQIAEQLEEELELLDVKPFETKAEFQRDHRGEEYYTADVQIPVKKQEQEKKEEPEKKNWLEGVKQFFYQLFQRNKPKQLPEPPPKRKGLHSYQLDAEKYSLPPERMSDIAKQRLLEDLKNNGRRGENYEIDSK